MPTIKGDLVFYNNYTLLHGRTGYSDTSPSATTSQYADASTAETSDPEVDSSSERLLHRLWLSDPHMSWKLPPILQLVWGRTFYDGSRIPVWELGSDEEQQSSLTVAKSEESDSDLEAGAKLPYRSQQIRPRPTAPCD